MTDRNPIVCDLMSSSSSSDDDYSLSSVDSFYDLFELGIGERGNIFVKYKVFTIDDFENLTTETTTTTSGSIFETDLPCTSIPSLSDDPWCRERAIRP
jgi:hypothetical protein